MAPGVAIKFILMKIYVVPYQIPQLVVVSREHTVLVTLASPHVARAACSQLHQNLPGYE